MYGRVLATALILSGTALTLWGTTPAEAGRVAGFYCAEEKTGAPRFSEDGDVICKKKYRAPLGLPTFEAQYKASDKAVHMEFEMVDEWRSKVRFVTKAGKAGPWYDLVRERGKSIDFNVFRAAFGQPLPRTTKFILNRDGTKLSLDVPRFETTIYERF